MATLTYDPSEPQDQEFTPEEQDNLEVGERLAEEQTQLLAGKFQSAEELEKEFEDHYWDFGQIYEKYGEPVNTFKQITGLPKITEE